MEELDILGSSVGLNVQIDSTSFDLDSVMVVASVDQMVDIDFPMAKLYPKRIRQWVSLPKGRSDLEFSSPVDSSKKLVSECRSRLLFSASWGEIGRVQVYALIVSGQISASDS